MTVVKRNNTISIINGLTVLNFNTLLPPYLVEAATEETNALTITSYPYFFTNSSSIVENGFSEIHLFRAIYLLIGIYSN